MRSAPWQAGRLALGHWHWHRDPMKDRKQAETGTTHIEFRMVDEKEEPGVKSLVKVWLATLKGSGGGSRIGRNQKSTKDLVR